MSYGKLIFDNKLLLDYILEFDDTYKQIFKKNLVFTKNILEASHIYWYNRYEKELLSNNCDNKLIYKLQDAYFDTLFLWDPSLSKQIRYYSSI